MAKSKVPEYKDSLEKKYENLLKLWTSENAIKTNKIQALMLVNSILVPAFILTNSSLFIALIGLLFSLFWIFSISRTLEFQDKWKEQMEKIRENDENNPFFNIHSYKKKYTFLGSLRSDTILKVTTITSAAIWAILLFVFGLIKLFNFINNVFQ